MLTLYDFAAARYAPWPGAREIPEGAIWIDANSPTAEDTAILKRALGVEPPSLARMSEIETSSRLYRLPDAVCVTLPLPRRDAGGHVAAHPLALIVTPKALLTVRYEDLKPFEPAKLESMSADRAPPPANAIGAVIAVLEGIVDHLADELELLTSRIDGCSRQVFGAPTRAVRQKGGDGLKTVITEIGRQREFSSLIEEALLTLARAVPFLTAELAPRLTPETRTRLKRLDRDVQSLASHEARMSDKLQFLLDASLGLIAVEQNDTFKVLTIVSVIGVPPTLVASMYGMNFKHMPELDWAWGYQWGLFLIAVSALIPLAWFKWRRWF